MVERFTVYPGVTYHTGQPHQNIKGEYVRYSDYETLQKELAERTAERDFDAHVNKMLLSWAADNGCEPDLLLSEWMGEKARAERAEEAFQIAESRADTLARRVEGLEAALRDQFCPRPCNGRPDKFGVGDCVDAGECGCSARAALTGERQ